MIKKQHCPKNDQALNYRKYCRNAGTPILIKQKLKLNPTKGTSDYYRDFIFGVQFNNIADN